jgi:sugar phosphate isomerase/epimerase
MSITRRKFLQTGSLLTAAGLMNLNKVFARKAVLKNYGLQLWTVKEDMAKDPQGVLKQVASFGYTQIESFEGGKGMFWGMTPADFKKYVSSLGMTAVSSHCNDIYKESFEKKAAESAEAGLKFLISPSESGAKTIDDYKKLANRFNECGAICKKNGLLFGYHNHDAIFKPIDNQIPMELLLDSTDKDTVVFEMDIYWVVTAGADPVAYLKKYKNRFRLGHVKDRIKNASEHDASCILGEGSIDFPKILDEAKEKGMEYFIVEQERFDNSTPLKSAEADAKYLSTINL